MGKDRHKITEEEFHTRLIQKEEHEMDEDGYEAWLDEVDKKEMEEANANWERYWEEMESDFEDKNEPTT